MLGIRARLLAFVADDSESRALQRMLEQAGATLRVRGGAGSRTIVKMRARPSPECQCPDTLT